MTGTRAAGAADRERVVVVVLNRDRRHLLLGCLEAVARVDHPGLAVVVVDNGSTDGSPDAVALAFPDVHLLRQPRNLGVAGGRNAGIAYALTALDPDWLLFIDDDTLLAPDSVAELVAAGRGSPGIGLVAPKAYRRPGEPSLVSAGGMRFNPYLGAAWDVAAGEVDRGQHDRPRDVEACPGFAFFVRRAVIDQVGRFDEGFNPYGWEDVELSLRAGGAGWRLVYAPRAVVHHLGGRAGRGPVGSYERHKVAKMLRLLRLHATPPQLLCFAVLLPFRAALRIGRELAGGNGGVVAAWLGGLLAGGRR